MDAKTKLMAVVGSPIEHSLSPRIHTRFAADCGINCAYLAFEVTPDSLQSFVSAARTLPIQGFNVTMPLKEHCIPLLDAVDDSALPYRAVNTVVNRDGVLCGYNTDGVGFLRALTYSGFAPTRINALILGAGGAARAVAVSLMGAGASVAVVCRRPDEAQRVDGVSYHGWAQLADVAEQCNLLVNATPLGMQGVDVQFDDLRFLETMPCGGMVFDLIYAPRKTLLLEHAERRGLLTANGLNHLICQAAVSFEWFCDVAVPRQTIDTVMSIIDD